MFERANKRFPGVKVRFNDAILANPDDVRAIYLLVDDPKKYHKFAAAENATGVTTKMALKRLLQSLSDLRHVIE